MTERRRRDSDARDVNSALARADSESEPSNSGLSQQAGTRCRVSQSENADAWDQFLAKHPDGHHEQCSEYGNQRFEAGFECDRVAVREAGQIVAGVQVLSRRTPIGRMAHILRGPLAEGNDRRHLASVVAQLEELAQRRRWVEVRVDMFPSQDAVQQVLVESGFVPTDAWANDRTSLVLPLSLSDADLVGRMKKKVRYGLRLAEKCGVTVASGSDSDIDEFYALHVRTAEHHGFPVFPRSYYEYLQRLFGPTGKIKLFVARFEGRAIAAIANMVVGQRVYYGWGGMDRGVRERKMMANLLLHRAAMRWGRDNGYTHYDLSGDSAFKRKLAGDPLMWPAPMRKYYGVCPRVRRMLSERSWSSPMLRRCVEGIGWRLGVRDKLPY